MNEEQARERRKALGTDIDAPPTGPMKQWHLWAFNLGVFFCFVVMPAVLAEDLEGKLFFGLIGCLGGWIMGSFSEFVKSDSKKKP